MNAMRDNGRLKIAIQKSGRLADMSLQLLEKCGISLAKSRDQLLCMADNFPLDVFLVRDDDIPAFLATNVCQLGILGQNALLEQQANENGKYAELQEVMALGYGKCRLSIAVPNDFDYKDITSLTGKTIATSYRGLLAKYLADKNVAADIVTMQGAVEVAPRTHLADVICDLVSTGNTLKSNGLRETDIVMQSQAVVIKNAITDPAITSIYEKLIARLRAVLRAENSRYIMLNSPISALDDIKAVLPGSQSPTVMPLQGREDMVAVHAVCEEGVFWNTMEALKAKGANSILVVPIEKMLD
ncbi:ATP phosphoribosyltransferase [Candidatus Puniceispirillum sp.]|uniref:ATP phosphoribosyltransferase n=1 Tax=Candidatus Puniceispirillum sp. TaxID=2026719 RepID=UPI003F69C1F3